LVTTDIEDVEQALRPVRVGGEGHDPSMVVSIMIHYKYESRVYQMFWAAGKLKLEVVEVEVVYLTRFPCLQRFWDIAIIDFVRLSTIRVLGNFGPIARVIWGRTLVWLLMMSLYSRDP